MNTRQLRYLVTIAEFENLSRAARALGVSQPALSKALSEWETLYGFSCFLRYRRQLIPTAVGQYMVDCAQRILDEQNRMMLTMRSITDRNRNRIRLCTAPNRAAIIYSQVYNRFSRKYPDVSLQLTELYAREQPMAVARGKVDLALGAGPVSDLVEDVPFARELLLVALPTSHPLANQERIRLEELRDTPFVLQGKCHSIRTIVDQLFEKESYDPVISFESDDVLLLDAMMHQGVGAGFVSKIHVHPCEELVYLPLDPPVYQLTHIRYPKGHSLTEAEQYLVGLLVQHRLNDPRYEPIHSQQAEAFFAAAESADQPVLPETARAVSSGERGAQETQEINLDTIVLEYLIAIVEEQGLSRAADRFYLAQPALSRHLRNMERMVGLALFSREHNRLSPTNVGKVFVNGARNILQIEREINEYVENYRHDHGGRLFIHCDPALAPRLRTRVAGAFSQGHPDVELAVVESNSDDTQEALLNASTDLGLFLTCTPSHPRLKNEILGLTELVYCADADNPILGLCWGDTLPNDLPSRALMLAPKGSTLRGEQDRLTEHLYTSPPRIVAQADFYLLQKLAAWGGADAILPLHLLSTAQRRHCYSLLPPQPYYLVMANNASRTRTEPIHFLMKLVRNAFHDFFFETDVENVQQV